MKQFVLVFLVVWVALSATAQDQVGSGRALRFDGVDDYVNLGNIYDNLTLPFTISAWIYMDPGASSGGPVFVSQDNSPLYNGFWFFVRPTSISIEYGDGRGENLPDYRKGKSASLPDQSSRWIHIAAVVNSGSDISLYVNGINVGGTPTGASNQPMASNYPTDIAKIGYFLSNGTTYRFKGAIDNIQVFQRSLNADEIRSFMTKKLVGTEAGLIGYWRFDETSGTVLTDHSSNSFHGQLNGQPTRIYSGAPIGDINAYRYTNTWNGVQLSIGELSVMNISGVPAGAHVYKVNAQPSQRTGLDAAAGLQGYYGVFLADLNTSKRFDFNFSSSGCKSFRRTDNSESLWNASTVESGIVNRIELIAVADLTSFVTDLGADKSFCNQDSYALKTTLSDTQGKSFLWSTGETTSSIVVSRSGTYSVQVSQGCFSDRDSITILLQKTPPVFSLGQDEMVCDFLPRVLKPMAEKGDHKFLWQDGSENISFEAKTHGVYWVKIENACGISFDSVEYVKPPEEKLYIPNIITPNGDNFNQFFEVLPVIPATRLFVYNRWGKRLYHSEEYQNNWDGGDLASGIYFYSLALGCLGERKGVITLQR